MSRDDSDETCLSRRNTGRDALTLSVAGPAVSSGRVFLPIGLCHADSIAFGDDGAGSSGFKIYDGKRSALLFEHNVEGDELGAGRVEA